MFDMSGGRVEYSENLEYLDLECLEIFSYKLRIFVLIVDYFKIGGSGRRGQKQNSRIARISRDQKLPILLHRQAKWRFIVKVAV